MAPDARVGDSPKLRSSCVDMSSVCEIGTVVVGIEEKSSVAHEGAARVVGQVLTYNGRPSVDAAEHPARDLAEGAGICERGGKHAVARCRPTSVASVPIQARPRLWGHLAVTWPRDVPGVAEHVFSALSHVQESFRRPPAAFQARDTS